jgi:uncharacterized membrane protein
MNERAAPTGNLASRLSLALVALAFAAVLALWGKLPDPMPTHWNLQGEVDGHVPKPWGPLIMPLAMALVHALLSIVPRLSGRALEGPAQRRVLGQVQLSVMLFLSVVAGASLLVALGVRVPFNRVLTAALGALIVGLGLSMGRLPRNGLVGIRTPWTLADEEVWKRTHALGARLFVIAGTVALVGGGMGMHLLPVLVGLGTAAVAPVFYSFRVYRKLRGNEPPRPL